MGKNRTPPMGSKMMSLIKMVRENRISINRLASTVENIKQIVEGLLEVFADDKKDDSVSDGKQDDTEKSQ